VEHFPWRRFLGMLLFLVIFAGALVGLFAGIYFLVGLVENLTAGHGWPAGWGASLANIVLLMLVILMVIASGLTVGERKWSAMMQNRIGPNRIRVGVGGFSNDLAGMPYLVADALKMVTKEAIRPSHRSAFLYELAPMIAFAPTFVLFAIVPLGPPLPMTFGDTVRTVSLQVAPGIDVGLLFVFAAASLAVYGTSLAGWSSNSKLAMLGGVRASSQMISYEVTLGLSLVGSMMAYQSLRLEDMIAAQSNTLWGFLPALGVFLQPLGMLVFFASSFAETKRTPFDLPEGESEIVGYFVEYPGMKFGMMMLGEFIEVVVLSAITTAIFFGGWHPIFFEGWLREHLLPLPFAAICAAVFLAKILILCWVQLIIRWTLPRFRFDQVQKLCWKMMLPVTLANVFLTGALVLADPSLELLGAVGILELVAIVAVTAAVGRKSPAAAQQPQHAAAHAVAGH
jgi:NADH-quinone oxidoreductase subunit H